MRELIFSARKDDFEVQTFCAGGPGGQHQNKTQSGVRIVHRATGLSAECRELRSQHQNKASAFRKLARQLVAFYTQPAERTISTEVIRTYHEPDNRVKDHASGLVLDYKSVMGKRGDLGPMIEARARAVR